MSAIRPLKESSAPRKRIASGTFDRKIVLVLITQPIFVALAYRAFGSIISRAVWDWIGFGSGVIFVTTLIVVWVWMFRDWLKSNRSSWWLALLIFTCPVGGIFYYMIRFPGSKPDPRCGNDVEDLNPTGDVAERSP